MSRLFYIHRNCRRWRATTGAFKRKHPVKFIRTDRPNFLHALHTCIMRKRYGCPSLPQCWTLNRQRQASACPGGKRGGQASSRRWSREEKRTQQGIEPWKGSHEPAFHTTNKVWHEKLFTHKLCTTSRVIWYRSHCCVDKLINSRSQLRNEKAG